MATAIPKNSVWSAMNYPPPRGRCNYKTSLMSPACPCLRFMLHPVKAATSFECDGCNHHASFHSLENPAEDAVIKKWEVVEKEKQATVGASKKRKRIAEKAEDRMPGVFEIVELDVGEDEQEKVLEQILTPSVSGSEAPTTRTRRGKKAAG
ncbi:hypothetical protein LTR37_016773 [Vermiconidia calcicola]|uniref:Uncharacterized protein n=1 Tax=Vermiconidia calcicola TaxID=1690605 RepID=A0ACC3MM46_9PEZI|nr:hypothetical protein LTR37_016773 [Vermiconidia calcicola]